MLGYWDCLGRSRRLHITSGPWNIRSALTLALVTVCGLPLLLHAGPAAAATSGGGVS